MKRLIAAGVFLLGIVPSVFGAPPGALTTLRAIHSLSNAEAAKQPAVDFDGTVTYYRHVGHVKNLFVQDGGAAIYIFTNPDYKLTPGDRVRVRGTMSSSFRPVVMSENIQILSHGKLPAPLPVDFDQLIRAEHDGVLIAARGVVRTADLVESETRDQTDLQILTEGGLIDAVVDSYDPAMLKKLLDAEVEIVGTGGGRFDGKMQQTGVQIHVTSLANVKILKSASATPWSLPVTAMGEILTGYHVNDLSRRIHVRGAVTYYRPGSTIVLQSGAQSLWVDSLTRSDLRIGDIADATGFPDARDGFLVLTGGEVQDTHHSAPVTPQIATAAQLASSRNIFDLVSIEAEVVAGVRESAQDNYSLVSDGHLFSAILRHPTNEVEVQLPPLKVIAPGSKVHVTGICILDESNPFAGPLSFNILLRSVDDITVVGRPSALSVRNLVILVGLLLVIMIAVGVRGWVLERRVRRQTAAAADLERRRSCILEDINGTRPLAEILEEIVETVSFMRNGAPCWCQIADGARLGSRPAEISHLRIAEEEIPSRSGPALGTLFIGFDRNLPILPADAEALTMGVGLATLAIESRRLYSDLRHRSEFDQLTDIYNRFSLEQQLDARIEDARQKAEIFGLVYVDLDKFKQVNDLYGHRLGDLYLQEAALRMKRQLRSEDSLARLGGDEFAVLLPVVRSIMDVEEIAQRLERCFDEPIFLEDHVLHGAASVGIALYPRDGTTKDDLLNVADTAMYEAKNGKLQVARMMDAESMSEITRPSA